MSATKVFLDTEFTGLHKNTTLLSLAMVAENGEEFYAEFSDYDENQVSDWVQENVMNKLQFRGNEFVMIKQGKTLMMKGDKDRVRIESELWLKQFNNIEIWADVLAYDWVLFGDLFGGAMKIPENIFYAPFDLATVFRMNGLIEPQKKYERDVKRFEFAGLDAQKQHHALEDARVEKICYHKLMGL